MYLSSVDVDVWTVYGNKITLFFLASPRLLQIQSEQVQGHTLRACVCVLTDEPLLFSCALILAV